VSSVSALRLISGFCLQKTPIFLMVSTVTFRVVVRPSGSYRNNKEKERGYARASCAIGGLKRVYRGETGDLEVAEVLRLDILQPIFPLILVLCINF